MFILKGRKNKTGVLETMTFFEYICYYWNQTTGAYCLLEHELIGNEEEKIKYSYSFSSNSSS